MTENQRLLALVAGHIASGLATRPDLFSGDSEKMLANTAVAIAYEIVLEVAQEYSDIDPAAFR